MDGRAILAGVLACAVVAVSPAWSQDKPAAGGIGNAVEQQIKGLTSDDFPEREAALKKLQALIAEQIKQRAAVQEVVDELQKDLAKQQAALAMVTDLEAQAQVAGLLEMERGLAAWTIQTMSEPAERRKELLAWGLSKEGVALVARIYSESKRTRIEAIRQLAKSDDDGAGWTLSRLINDNDPAIRAGAMAAAWSHKPQNDIVASLWFRAVAGPMSQTDQRMKMGAMNGVEMPGMGPDAQTIKIEFPDGDPMEFDPGEDADQFSDSLLAGSILVHLKPPQLADKVKAIVSERQKAGKSLAMDDDMDMTLVLHWLIETYQIKEAVPMLASEALGSSTDEMGGEMNGQNYTFTPRTMAIGVLSELVGKDPSDFGLKHFHDSTEMRGWMWGVETNQMNMMNPNNADPQDGPPMRAFYTWWKANHAQFGVADEPSNAAVPIDPALAPPRRGRGGGFNGGRGPIPPVQIQPGGPVQILPAPVPMPFGANGNAPEAVPGAAPGAGQAEPGNPGPAENQPQIDPAPPINVPIVPSRNRPPITRGAAG